MTAEETAVALVHDGSTTAVMMATPQDLEDLALGFSLSEGIIETASDIQSLEIVRQPLGWEARMWLTHEKGGRQRLRRRHLAGPTGCGLCGVDSLEEAMRPPRTIVQDISVSTDQIMEAIALLDETTPLGVRTRAVHAAALWNGSASLLVREDVGRHNALDKLVGASVREPAAPTSGMLLLTSRVSVEMVQKASVLGAPILCAISAPTFAAVQCAQACGLTLVGITRHDSFELFTHPHRVETD